MHFVYPEFLFALLLVAVPIIIHLFNFRRFKKIYFTNVKFLKDIKEETTSRSKLKHLLVLLSRILAISFLVFAFAQPFIPVGNKNIISNDKTVSIYIDNSFSMESVVREGTLLDEAKKKAREIAMAYKPSDNFQVLTNDFEARHQRLMNREEFLDLIDQVKTSPATKKLSEIISRQTDALNNSGAKSKLIYLLSDYQKTSADIKDLHADTSTTVNLIPLNEQATANIFIDSCWFTSPVIQVNKPCELNVRIKNSSENDLENVSLKLTINGNQKSLAGVVSKANSTVDTKLNFTLSENGWQKAELSINDHPITFDDTWYFSFEVKQNLQLLCINKKAESPYIKALFSSENYFILNNSNAEQIDYATLPRNNVVILNELNTVSSGLASELKKYVSNGGTLVVFPDSAIDQNSYQTFLLSLNADTYTAINNNADKVDRLSTESAVYQNVFDEKQKRNENIDLPLVLKHYEFSGSSHSNREVIMKLQGGGSFLSKFESGKGKIYLFAVPLSASFTNFVKHAVFVPTLYKIALLSEQEQNLFNIIGRDNGYEVAENNISGEEVFHLVNTGKKFDIIPEQRSGTNYINLFFRDQVKESGNYDLLFKNKLSGIVSFDYDRKESVMSFYNKDEITKIIDENHLSNLKLFEVTSKGITAQLMELNEGIRLWKWGIVMVLIFLAIEILLLKFLK
ncbi:MAG: BatA domain-containing protein [Bacteroidia bacterium]